MRRPRIAIVAPTLDIVGGQAVQANAIMAALRHEGYQVAFVPINPTFPRGLRRVRAWPYWRTVVNQAMYLPSLARLRAVDVVHVFSASYWSFLLAPVPAILVARALGKRVILNYRSGEAGDHLARWGLLVHPWLRLAHDVVVPSEHLRSVFARHGYRARVVRNVVDTSRFAFRPRLPLRPRLLSARNFEPHYRVANTIDAFALVRARHEDATLLLAGSGTDEMALRARASAHAAPGSVRFLGQVAPGAMPAVYADADIFVNSTVIDNQPNSVLEAMASGLPIVSTPTGEIGAMIRDGETGLLVPADDPAAMAKAVLDILEHPERAAAMARRAREAAAAYGWADVRDAWSAVYSGAAA
jgi:L-malate glycosyltransferase